jgi:hypothetical protein
MTEKFAALKQEFTNEESTGEFGDETILTLTNGRSIHTAAYPGAADYVRVVEDGKEIAYWSSDEWREDPAGVMGAIFGAANLGKLHKESRDVG